jgi:hypothetical protein
MSGKEEIFPWIMKNFEPSEFESPAEWIESASSDFISNNRLPLDEILDSQEMEELIEKFTNLKGIKKELFNTLNKNVFSEFSIDDLESETGLNRNSIRSALSKLTTNDFIIRVSRGIYQAK